MRQEPQHRRVKYDQLQEGQFRLAVIEPGAESDELRCVVMTSYWFLPQPYITLSYTWGDLTPKSMDQMLGLGCHVTRHA